VAVLQPKNSAIYYSLGLLYVQKADEVYVVVNNKIYTSQAEFEKARAQYYDIYVKAVPLLEEANRLNPTDKNTVILLKDLTFRLRELPDMMDKHNKFKAIFESMQ